MTEITSTIELTYEEFYYLYKCICNARNVVEKHCSDSFETMPLDNILKRMTQSSPTENHTVAFELDYGEAGRAAMTCENTKIFNPIYSRLAKKCHDVQKAIETDEE